MKKKISAKDQFWFNHIEQASNLDIPQATYCRQHGLNPKTFSVRKSQYKKWKNSQNISKNDNFVPLETNKSSISIKLSTGLELIFDKIPDPNWMGAVIQSLGISHDQY